MQVLHRLAPLAILAALSLLSWAQSFPTKPITLVVAFPPGGTSDALARGLQEPLAKRLRQPVVINNVGGAGGVVGSERALQAEPDGHTLLLANSSVLTAFAFADKVQVHPREATFLAPIGQVPHVLVVNAATPYKSFGDLLKSKDKVTIAAYGPGTQSFVNAHGLAALLAQGTEVVPFRGQDGMQALLSGQIVAGFFAYPDVASHVSAGKLRALAVTGGERTKEFRDVPTMAEAGAKGAFAGEWFFVLAPKGVPPATAKVLSAAIAGAAQETLPQFASRLGLAPLELSERSYGLTIDQRFAQSVGGGGTPVCATGKCYCKKTKECQDVCTNC